MTTIVEPHAHLWTTEEYYTVAETGIFAEKQVELVEGEIIEMSPMTSMHAMVIHMAQDALRRVFGAGYLIAAQAPLNLSAISEPQPDVAVYRGAARDYLIHKPTDPLLLIEVADTSLRYDRGKKASLYARAGIADYWIVNLKDGALEVYRDPAPDPAQEYGYGYSTVRQLARTAAIAPLALPASSIAIADLLP